MKIHIEDLQKIVSPKNKRYKKESWIKNITIVKNLPEFYRGCKEWLERESNYKSYDVAATIISIYRWIVAERNNRKRFHLDKTKRPSINNYEIREIIIVDFGGTNYGVEASYEHPAIVLHNGFYFLTVIPCSSGRIGKSKDYILPGDRSQNFVGPTGVQLDQIRVIDKSRVINRTGEKVPPEFMKTINDKILKVYLTPLAKKMSKLEQENIKLQQKIYELETVQEIVATKENKE